MTLLESAETRNVTAHVVHSSYPVAVRWSGDHRVVAESVDGLPALEVAPPPAFAGPEGVWSPEHLLVLAAASCWLTTFLAMAERSKIALHSVVADAEGTVERRADRRFDIPSIVLRPLVTIDHEQDRERTRRLIEKAEATCLVGNSILAEIALEPVIVVADEADTKPLAGDASERGDSDAERGW